MSLLSVRIQIHLTYSLPKEGLVQMWSIVLDTELKINLVGMKVGFHLFLKHVLLHCQERYSMSLSKLLVSQMYKFHGQLHITGEV